MAPNDLAEALSESVQLQRAVKTQSLRDVIGTRFQLLEKPEPLLGKGKRGRRPRQPSRNTISLGEGQASLLEAIVAESPEAAVQIVCSNEDYGKPLPEELPLRETTPMPDSRPP